MALGSDFDFYGGFGLGGGFGSPGLYQPWQSASQSPYVGFSGFAPDPTQYLPSTLSGYASQFMPELGGISGLGRRLGGDLAQAYQTFRGSDAARAPGGAGGFTEQLLADPNVQRLLEQQEFAQEGAFIEDGLEGVRSLTDIVQEQFGTEGSRLSNIYGQAGIGAEEAEADLRRFLGGDTSAVGDVTSFEMFGGRGKHTRGSREAILAQLLGDELVDVGGGRVFNPFSEEVFGDMYRTTTGTDQLQGTELLRLTGGLLSTQNLDITQGIQQAFGTALDTGADLAFGGKRGYRLTQAIAGQGAPQLGEGQSIAQDQRLQNAIDTWFAGGAGRGFGRGLPSFLQSRVQNA
jgi:hypothetical protein